MSVPAKDRSFGVNRTKPDRWKADVSHSVDMYNDWFIKFAPVAYRETRIKTTADVESTLAKTDNLADVSAAVLRREPGILPTLRMSACPPLAVDRLIGLASVSRNLVGRMERGTLPHRMDERLIETDLKKIGDIAQRMADPDIFVWLRRSEKATNEELHRAATIIADRLCGAVANPIIRNAQEKRQFAAIRDWLEMRGYEHLAPKVKFGAMPPGTFTFRMNVPAKHERTGAIINIPADVVVMPKNRKPGELPVLIEAKSAGDYTNVNKRRKEEATKMSQLRFAYGKKIRFILFLCGYFDSGYLGYEAAEGIDWVWEHRIEELAEFGL
ncbi:MAG: XamI family restriction endonuclease [Candidatus Binataceae bacterium]